MQNCIENPVNCFTSEYHKIQNQFFPFNLKRKFVSIIIFLSIYLPDMKKMRAKYKHTYFDQILMMLFCEMTYLWDIFFFYIKKIIFISE